MSRVYLDSCIIIYAVQGRAEVRARVLRALAEDTPTGPAKWCVSQLSRLECRVWPMRERKPMLLAEFDRFFASRDLIWAPWTWAVFDRATELRARAGLKTPDALHVAAAIQAGCDELWTNDRRWPRSIEDEIGLRILD